jgi:hypothetical protein
MSDSYVTPDTTRRVFDSIDLARKSPLAAGDVVSVRDMRTVAPRESISDVASRGRWHARAYSLASGERGVLIEIEARNALDPHSVIPPAFETLLDLDGPFAIFIGVPRHQLHPVANFPALGGVDVALDGDPSPVHIGAERGARGGRIMGPTNVEILCYWKCAILNGRSMRIGVPYGTFLSFPWGLVRAGISCLRLVRLSDQQFAEYQRDISDPSTKRVMVVNDGFGHYWTAGEPGCGIDARFVQQYRDTDVKILMLQAPATGVASWPSKVTSLVGEEMPEELWAKARGGDRRVHDYVRWAVDNNQDGMRVVSQACRDAGIEFHASLRMNLFFDDRWQYGPMGSLLNGRWWGEHPEARKPGGVQLDYANPAARDFILRMLGEMAVHARPDAINLDFTRWPPIADPARHGPEVLTSFIAEVRRMLYGISGTRIKLSALVTDGYHARATLEEQKINLNAWLSSGNLDVIGVQAWDHAKYLSLARHHGVKYFAIHDTDSFRFPPGEDPQWRQTDRPDEDPLPGEELQSQPHLNNALDPTEYDEGFLKHYRLGVDGVCVINNFMGMRSTGRLGHVEEMWRRSASGEVWGQIVSAEMFIEE